METLQTLKSFAYPLVIGLPHTNRHGLSEPQLMMYAGHFQWNSIAAAFGRPLSQICTKEGKPIYATFFYIEEHFPPSRPLADFHLDQEVLFLNRIRHFKGMSIDGEIIFDRKDLLSDRQRELFAENPAALVVNHPFLRMCNVFISRAGGNDFLKITTPEASVSFDRIMPLPPEENPYGLTREAAQNMTFGLFDSDWRSMDQRPDFHVDYEVDPDRDTNGAGLIYFAQYLAFIATAERSALLQNSTIAEGRVNMLTRPRTVSERKLGYYGNVRLDDTLRLSVSLYANHENSMGFRCRITRRSDGKLIALSESIQVFVDNAIEENIRQRTS